MPHPFDEFVRTERKHPLPVKQLLAYWSTQSAQERQKKRANLIKQTFHSCSLITEIGCGFGVFNKVFDDASTKMIASDLTPENLTYALKENWIQPGTCLASDAHQTPFADESFAGVFGNAILHHLNCNYALKECYRILKPGGKILFFEPNMANPMVWLVKHWDWLGKRYHETPGETAFYRHELKHYVEQAGFDEVECSYFDFCHFPDILLSLVKKVEPLLEASPLKVFSGSLLLQASKH